MPRISCIPCFSSPSRPTTSPVISRTSSPSRGESSTATISKPFTPVELDETTKNDLLNIMTQLIIDRKQKWHDINDTTYVENLEASAHTEAHRELNKLIKDGTLSLEIIQEKKDEYKKLQEKLKERIQTQNIRSVVRHPNTINSNGEEITPEPVVAKPVPYDSNKD